MLFSMRLTRITLCVPSEDNDGETAIRRYVTMKRNIVLSLFVGMIAVVFNNAAIAQVMPDVPTPSPASSGKNEQGGKGGQQRGLDRTDQAAGQHGQPGRETAREAQLNRQTHPERSGMSERPAKPERPGR
jgi:hypothetical protein